LLKVVNFDHSLNRHLLAELMSTFLLLDFLLDLAFFVLLLLVLWSPQEPRTRW